MILGNRKFIIRLDESDKYLNKKLKLSVRVIFVIPTRLGKKGVMKI